MYAESLLGAVRDVERRIDELLSATVLAGESSTWRHAAALRATLLDLAELLRANTPIPIDADSDDPAFRTALDAVYRSGPLSPDRLAERLSGGSATVDRLSADGRLVVVGSRVLVPLGRAPENWPPIVSLLQTAFEAVAPDVRRVRGRLWADGVRADGPLASAWDGLVEMVEAMADFLAYLSGYGRYINDWAREDDSGATEFADWTITQLTEDT